MTNYLLRSLIRFFFSLLNVIIRMHQAYTRRTITSKWQKMSVPPHGVLDFEAQKLTLQQHYDSLSGDKWWVQTSGTRKEPKKIPYSNKRIQELNKEFLKSMIVMTSEFKGIKTFFAFGSLEKDQSLTSSMIDESQRPSHPELLQAPYRYLATKEGRELRNLTGDLGARVAVLVVSMPRFIYATNPSTLTHFIDELNKNWPKIQHHLKTLLRDMQVLNALLKLQDGNATDRLQRLASINEFKKELIFPEIKAVITWDGGYVRSFLNRLMKLLPENTRHIPMYSMSTESIETLPHRIDNELAFLPTMKGTLPEFLDSLGKILKPHELQPGSIYTLIITNKWGLERYDTQDEFKVVKMINGLPSLIFMRRRNITASLTGEKITEEQAIILQTMIKQKHPHIAHSSLSLFPTIGVNSAGYQMAIIGTVELNTLAIKNDAESYLSEINNEYRDKVKSGRLLPIKVEMMSVLELAKLMGQEHRWESQFKVMPLYEKPVSKN